MKILMEIHAIWVPWGAMARNNIFKYGGFFLQGHPLSIQQCSTAMQFLERSPYLPPAWSGNKQAHFPPQAVQAGPGSAAKSDTALASEMLPWAGLCRWWGKSRARS
jgi:hypothetical protein